MQLSDLNKDVRRILLKHWTAAEIEDRLSDPDYFFNQVVIPRLDYLRKTNEDLPRIRVQRMANGDPRILLL